MLRAATASTTGVLVLGLLAAPASAAPGGDPVLDFQGKSNIRSVGLLCTGVPAQGGGAGPSGMLVTSNSSERTATAQYVQSFYGGPPLFWSTARIMVVKATHQYVAFGSGDSYRIIDGTAERPGPLAGARGHCQYSGYSGRGDMEVVYLTPAKPPSAKALADWCASWSEPNATLYRPAGMCDD